MSASVPARGRRHPMTVVTQVRRLADAGWQPTAIVRLLADDGIQASLRSVIRWTNPAVAEADRMHDLRRRRRDASQRSGRLGLHITNVTDDFKMRRVRALSEEAGLSCRSIARAMAFDFGDDVDEVQIRYALTVSGRYPRCRPRTQVAA